jgi:hypothetical protein
VVLNPNLVNCFTPRPGISEITCQNHIAACAKRDVHISSKNKQKKPATDKAASLKEAS